MFASLALLAVVTGKRTLGGKILADGVVCNERARRNEATTGGV